MAHNNDYDAESTTTASDLNSIAGANFMPYPQYQNHQLMQPTMYHSPSTHGQQQYQYHNNHFNGNHMRWINHPNNQSHSSHSIYHNMNNTNGQQSRFNNNRANDHYNPNNNTHYPSMTIPQQPRQQQGYAQYHQHQMLIQQQQGRPDITKSDLPEKCRYYHPGNPDSCRYGNKCRYRHENIEPAISIVPGTKDRIHGAQENDDRYRKTRTTQGYIHELQSLVYMDNTTNILLANADIDSIINVIRGRYYKPFWNHDTTNRMIHIKDNTITNVFPNGFVSAFSVDYVSSGTHEWKLKVIESKGELEIGIMENPNQPHANEKFWRVSGGIAYFNQRRGYINFAGANYYDFPKSKRYGIEYSKNDVISVCLNMDSPQLSFSVNDINCGVIPYQIKGNAQYHLAVGLECKGDSVQFME